MATRRDVFSEVEFSTVVGVAEAMRGEARTAGSTQEAWAMRALVALTSDCDGAVTDDGVGFNKSDTGAGRYLGHYVEIGGKLDDVEWSSAIDMLRKYHGQIGNCPRPDDLDLAREARVQAQGGDGFRDRIKAVHTEAKRVQKDRDRMTREFKRRINQPEVTIRLAPGGHDGKGLWLVHTPYNANAVEAWRELHREHGGRWDGDRRVRVVPYRAARALNALLERHHDAQMASGPKGLFIIGNGDAPVEIKTTDPEAVNALAAQMAARVLALPPLPPELEDEDEDEDESADEYEGSVAPTPAPITPAPAPAEDTDERERQLAMALAQLRRRA